MSIVKSPSQTDSFSICPIMWWLEYQEHWTPRIRSKAGLAAFMGTAMAAGVAKIHENSPEEAVVTATAQWTAQLLEFREAGGVIDELDPDKYPDLIKRGLTWYATHNPLPADWKVLAVEHTFPEHGYCRTDLDVRRPDGMVIPVDHKWKESLYVKAGESRDQARNRTSLDWAQDWKMMHYCWAISEHYNVKCREYAIVLGELTPYPHTTVFRYHVSNDMLDLWYKSNEEISARIHTQEKGPWRFQPMPTRHDTKYGPCKFFDPTDGCAFVNPDRLQTKFIQIKRGSNAIRSRTGT